jgi:hypothetical protein
MKLKSLLAPIAAAALLASAASAQAALTVYTTQASFLAAISASGVDTFDDLDPTAPLATPQSRTAGSYSYTASVGPTSTFFPAGTLGGDAWLGTDNRTDTVTFSGFSAGVRAVGGYFFGSDISGLFTGAQVITVQATDGSGSSTQSLLTPTTGSFIGFVSSGAMTSLQTWVGVQGTGQASVWPTINNLTLGTVAAVPEPQTYALLLGGLGLVGFMARRKKQA